MRLAVGFACPACQCDTAHVERVALPQVELRCAGCDYMFCVEP